MMVDPNTNTLIRVRVVECLRCRKSFTTEGVECFCPDCPNVAPVREPEPSLAERILTRTFNIVLIAMALYGVREIFKHYSTR